jgi:hypothetical protein
MKTLPNQAASESARDKAHLITHSTVDVLLSRLDRVKRTGSGTWSARCPAHADRGPSLTVRELDDGRILLHCFAGCDVHDVLAAVDLDISDLFPRRAIDLPVKPERRPFPAADVLRAIAFEALIVAAAGVSLLAGHPFSPADRDRLILAVSRIQSALTAAGVTNHG